MNLSDLTVDALLDSIGSKTPVPGGGAVASLTMALGAALGRMVVAYSHGKKSLAAHTALHDEALGALETMQAVALEGAAEDARAYGRLNELWKLDAADERRQREFEGAVRDAIAAPHGIMNACLQLLELLVRLDGATNAMLRSDLAIAAVLAEAAARSAAWNVRINLPLLNDQAETEAIERATAETLERAAGIVRNIETACRA